MQEFNLADIRAIFLIKGHGIFRQSDMLNSMRRAYFSDTIVNFLAADPDAILGRLSAAQGDVDAQQSNAWNEEIRILKSSLLGISGQVYVEFSIPRMGKRVDAIVIAQGIIFPIEFKVFSDRFDRAALDQVMDYALDLKNFHEQSHDKTIIPILVATNATPSGNILTVATDDVYEPMKATAGTLRQAIVAALDTVKTDNIDIAIWEKSGYSPTPTIIEAAQALYAGHTVEDISRSDAGAINLNKTADAVLEIINSSKQNHQKAICFITGVPGAGKTLAGLNLANKWHDFASNEHAVFLSGNGPLVKVLQAALIRQDRAGRANGGVKAKRNESGRAVDSFIQNIHHFRDDGLAERVRPPAEHVAIFDEAQRAWTKEQTAKFMQQKKHIPNFDMSEPEFLISYLDRHTDWATIVCLVGGGQEINTGEAGLPEWFLALKHRFKHWHVYLSPELNDTEYTRGTPLFQPAELPNVHAQDTSLHLSIPTRTFRSPSVAAFVKAVLDGDTNQAKHLYTQLSRYPIVVTRDINKAKQWLKNHAKGNARYGVVASSDAMRLRPYGLHVKAEVDPVNWFLNDKEDVRSSCFLEEVATEFDVQGLELDWVCVAWDADFYYDGNVWNYMTFRGTAWQNIHSQENQVYRKNAYRVLLTRARQGMVIFIPLGDRNDITRKYELYDETWNYWRSLGVVQLD